MENNSSGKRCLCSNYTARASQSLRAPAVCYYDCKICSFDFHSIRIWWLLQRESIHVLTRGLFRPNVNKKNRFKTTKNKGRTLFNYIFCILRNYRNHCRRKEKRNKNKLFWNVTFVYTSASFALWDTFWRTKAKRATFTAPWDEKVPLFFFPNSAQKTNNYILDCLYLLHDWAVQADRSGQIN